MIKVVVFDMDGVLRVGQNLISGVSGTIDYLNDKNIKYYINTNECRFTEEDLRNQLKRGGLSINNEVPIYSSGNAVRDYLKDKIIRFPKRKFIIGFIGEEGLSQNINELSKYHNVRIKDYLKNGNLNNNGLGNNMNNSNSSGDLQESLRYNNDGSSIYLVIGTVNKIKIKHLEKILFWVNNGAKVIITCGDTSDPSSKGDFTLGMPNHLLHMSGFNINTKSYSLGKPHQIHSQKILELFPGINPNEILFVGDTLYTDIRLAEESGFQSALVLTGNTRSEGLKNYVTEPDFVINNLYQIKEIIEYQNE